MTTTRCWLRWRSTTRPSSTQWRRTSTGAASRRRHASRQRVGDAWGRGLRYGLGKDQPDSPADFSDAEGLTRGQAMETVAQLAEAIDEMEDLEFSIARVAPQLAGLKEQTQALMDTLLAVVSAPGGVK
jgi:hypothetical protein